MEEETYKVTNIMKNGEVIADLTGYVVPLENAVNDFFYKKNKELIEGAST